MVLFHFCSFMNKVYMGENILLIHRIFLVNWLLCFGVLGYGNIMILVYWNWVASKYT